MNSYIILNNSLVVVTGGKQYTVDNTHPSYTAIIEAIKAGNFESIPGLADVGKHINNLGKNKITVVDGRIMYGNDEVHNVLTERILNMLREGFNIDPMIALLENLMANPTKTAIGEFYLFIEKNKMPITEDGCILAYKRVDKDYLDSYSRSVSNKPASLMTDADRAMLPATSTGGVTTEIIDGFTVVHMPPSKVDANRNNLCSTGLHFCSLGYLGDYRNNSGQTVIVKINPRDIVAIPYDYDNTKGRCWRYTVIESLVTDENRNITEEVYNNVSVVPAAVVASGHMAYDEGYRHGRAKEIRSYVEGDNSSYDQGYKDGRGKKKRKYPAIKTTQE